MIEKGNAVAKAHQFAVGEERDESWRANMWIGVEVWLSLGSIDPLLEGYNRRIAERRARGEDSTQEEPVEPGSDRDVARKFWRAVGFKPAGFWAHLYRSHNKGDGPRID